LLYFICKNFKIKIHNFKEQLLSGLGNYAIDVDSIRLKKGEKMMSEGLARDKAEIKELIEKWYVSRDYFWWDAFREAWHDDGVMVATWTEAPVEGFIENCEKHRKSSGGFTGMHYLAGSIIDVNGSRARAVNKIIITERRDVNGVRCDMFNYARHFDFWEKRGRWGLVRRETICDKDTLYPVRDSDRNLLSLDENILNKYPEEYQYLAYFIVGRGDKVSTDVPRYSGEGVPGSSLERLYEKGRAWLSGELENPNAK
jgi:hypothetical protein